MCYEFCTRALSTVVPGLKRLNEYSSFNTTTALKVPLQTATKKLNLYGKRPNLGLPTLPQIHSLKSIQLYRLIKHLIKLMIGRYSRWQQNSANIIELKKRLIYSASVENIF